MAEENLEETNETTETVLSIPEGWNLTNEDYYVYSFYNYESPQLDINQLSIYGIEIFEVKEDIEVTGLIRSTVEKEIELGLTTIVLLDGENEILGRKEFDLTKLGALPTNRARPWKFKFTQQDLTKDVELPLSSWSLAFEIKGDHTLDLDKSWEDVITDETKQNLQNIVENAKELKPGEINIMGLDIQYEENGDLATTILIRNGTLKEITFDQLPLAISDATGDEIAMGSFTLDNFSVKSNTSKPWKFVFPSPLVSKNKPDLNKWRIYIIDN